MCAQPSQDKKLQSLIDIPWGKTDCLRLALAAQAVLFDRKIPVMQNMDWCNADLRERSQEIAKFIADYATEIDAPETGAVALIGSLGYVHLATFTDIEHLLTIRIDGRSEIVYYSEAYKRLTKKIYRITKWR